MIDYVIHKFRRINESFQKSLENSELYFAHPDQLNDPFDCRVDILDSLDRAIRSASASKRDQLKGLCEWMNDSVNINQLKSFIENVGVCSFSLELENTLMWSHYADNHRGVCLNYGFPKSFFDDTKDEVLGIVKVDYGLNPLSDWFLKEVFKKYIPCDNFIRSLIKKAFTVKAELWQYEKEVRIVRKNAGIQTIDKQFLKQICFGLATPDTDIALVKNIIGQGGYDIDLFKMTRSTSTDFGLEPLEL
jgi:hypothetical protein